MVFALQDKAEQWLKERYNGTQCMHQDVTKSKVFEQWYGIRKSDNQHTLIMVVLTKERELISYYELIPNVLQS